MTSIPKEQILRLNCPGYGEESYLTLGKARSLDTYSVIVVNPISILHLFDRAPDAVREIDTKLAEGLTSYTVKGDELLQALEADLKKRIFELVNFLEKGGLLVYYLCRPFLVQGNSLSMDNYYWLESLAPDTPSESNVRHMSAVSHGRIVEPTEHAEKSEFIAYLQQSGLEWNTIIRTDFLTEGYIVLATAGPRKCISAHLIAGDTGGRIVFLPSPYSPDFDKSLMDGVEIWHERKVAEFGAPAAAAAAVPEPQAKPEPAKAEPVSAGSTFSQPDPAKFLSPKAETQAPAEAARPTPPPARSASQSPTSSRSNLPPVTKFTTSRPMPGAGTGENQGRSAEDIVQAVSEQAALAADNPAEPVPFNERATSDIHTAFAKLNSPLPQPTDSGGYQVPSAADLLKELESMSAPEQPAKQAAAEKPEPFARPVEQKPKEESKPPEPVEPARTSRNLLKEMESAGTPSTPPAKEEKTFFEALSSKAEEKPPTPPAASEQQTGYKYGIDKEAPKPRPEPPKVEPPKAEPITTPPPPKTEQPVSPLIRRPPPQEAQQKNGGQFSQPEPAKPAEVRGIDNNRHDTEVQRTPEAKDLIKKMEEITKAAPDWCKEYTFPDLEDLKRERNNLTESIRQTQAKISTLEDRIAMLEGLKNALLASEGEQLMTSCSRVFKRMGWNAKASDKHEGEFVLNINDKAEVIARVVRSNAQAKAGDVAELAQAVITFWGEHEIEPKGVLIACTWANRPPSERNEPDYTDALCDFAQKKNLCLMTTMQLLSIYRDLEMGKISPEEIRRRILDTNGRLSGFALESSMSRAGA